MEIGKPFPAWGFHLLYQHIWQHSTTEKSTYTVYLSFTFKGLESRLQMLLVSFDCEHTKCQDQWVRRREGGGSFVVSSSFVGEYGPNGSKQYFKIYELLSFMYICCEWVERTFIQDYFDTGIMRAHTCTTRTHHGFTFLWAAFHGMIEASAA